MKRVLEPEILMDDNDQAEAYAASDFTVPHNLFVDRFGAYFPNFSEGRIADLCCGPCDPTIRLAQRYPEVTIDAYDGAPAMLTLAREAIKKKRLGGRIALKCEMLPLPQIEQGVGYDAIVCNGSLHHFAEAKTMWQTLKNIAKPGTIVYIVDLTRPATEEGLQALINATRELRAPEKMVEDYENSLRAAFRPEEIRLDLDKNGLWHLRVEVTSPTHMTIWGRL